MGKIIKKTLPKNVRSELKSGVADFISPSAFRYPEKIDKSGWIEHIPFAFWLMEHACPRLLVELGVHYGVSYLAFCQSVQQNGLGTKCFGVDTWKGDDHAGFYNDDVYEALIAYHDARYSDFSRLVRSTFSEAIHYFEDRTVDLLHIDGRHGYEDVQRDFESWRPKLSSRAVVLFHDTNVRENDFGVFRFWKELIKHHTENFEFYHGNGLGVLGFGDDLPGPVRAFFASGRDEESAVSIRAAYCRLGRGLTDAFTVQQNGEELSALRDALAEAKDYARNLETEIAERDRRLTDAQEKADAQERAEQQLAEATAYARHLETHLGQASSSLVEAASYARNLESELARRAFERQSANDKLDAILNSNSWQISNPFRELALRNTVVRKILNRTARLALWILLRPRRRVVQQNSVPLPTAPEPKPWSKRAIDRISHTEQNGNLKEKAALNERARAELGNFLASAARLVFPVTEVPSISVIIVVHNQAHLTLRCLRALMDQNGPSFEVVLVDNASKDDTGKLLSRLENVRVLSNTTNVGFLLGCNQAAAAARGRALLLLNSDAFMRPGALSSALAMLDLAPQIGAVGGRLILPSGRLQEAGCIVWADGSTLGYARGLPPEAGEAMFRRDVDYCSGAFLMTPTNLWQTLGGFDAAFSPAYYEDVDYCMRLRKIGYRVVYDPTVIVDHFEFGSAVEKDSPSAAMLRNRKLFRSRHAETLHVHHMRASPKNVLAARVRSAPSSRRLLIIDNEVPLTALGSGYPRASKIITEAVTLGWAVTFFPMHQLDVDWQSTRAEIPWEVEVVTGRGESGLADFLEERHDYYNAILISRPANMSILLKVLDDKPHLIDRTRLIYDAEALFANRDIAKAAAEGPPLPESDAEALVAAEVALAEGADAITCVTEAEANAFRVRQSASVHVLSHSIDACAATPGFAARTGFLFVGRLLERDTPNWQGLLWFVRKCWPLIHSTLPNTTLSVAGHLHPEHAELEAAGVQLLGPITDLKPVYDAARVFIAPIQYAAGIPIKILEATAAGLPTAGTLLMARQLMWSPNIEIIASDDVAALAASASNLHENATAWEAIRSAARRRVECDHGTAAFRHCLRGLLDAKADLD